MADTFRVLQERLRGLLLQKIAAGELTGIQLARAAGFQQAHISNFLNRKRGLSLEAMDAVLSVIGVDLKELLGPQPRLYRTSGSRSVAHGNFVLVPLLRVADCYASRVPKTAGRHSVPVARSWAEHLPSRMAVPRPHWDRLVALRVPRSEAEAMFPRLTADSVAIIDRHFNCPAEMGKVHPIFAVRHDKNLLFRYLEETGGQVTLRPENASAPLAPLEDAGSVIGRVVMVITQL